MMAHGREGRTQVAAYVPEALRMEMSIALIRRRSNFTRWLIAAMQAYVIATANQDYDGAVARRTRTEVSP